MKQAGYGAEITKVVENIPYEDLIETKEVAAQIAVRCAIPYDKAKAVVNVKLKRLADHGKLKRLKKGAYCHVRQTAFGPAAPNIDKLMENHVTMKDGARIGYESGESLLNRIGVSTQLPRTIEITTNQYHTLIPEECHIKLRKPITTVTNSNWKYLQFIDATECMMDVFHDVEAPVQAFGALARQRELDPLTLIFTARKYYSPKTVLRLTDMMMEVNHESASRQGSI